MSSSDQSRDAQKALHKRDVHPDPIEQFRQWFELAQSADLWEPTAMTLATATPDGKPSARTVLLKSYDSRGFVFYSHYLSRKGQELTANPWAALLFWWGELERQIRIEGHTERIDEADSDAYFRSRPTESKISAAVSPQSEVIPDRRWLETRMEELAQQHPDGDVPRPENWGGTRVIPVTFEFWQGRPGRVHDRIQYRKSEKGRWIIERLAP